jgi:hypothetical protein
MNFRNKYCFICVACFLVLSCNNAPTRSYGPIKLGDPSTIITETDPHKLQDMVIDLKPEIPSSTVVVDTPKTAAIQLKNVDTAKKQVAAATPPPAALPNGPGLKAEFKDVTVMLPNVNAKLSGKPNLTNANGAVYTWLSGNFAGNVLRTTGIVTKVSQRYQSIVVLKTKNGNLPLEELSETTGWKPVTGGNGVYPIAGLNENELAFSDADANDIKQAVTKSARSRRLGSKKTQEWLGALGGVRAANQKPLVVTLRSLMWKIDGKDTNGKIYSKQIRIDIPM